MTEARSFRMGTNAYPYDFEPDSIMNAVDIAVQHSDQVMVHMDNGFPIRELLDGSPLPSNVVDWLTIIGTKTQEAPAVYVAAPLQHSTRNRIAGRWDNSGIGQSHGAELDGLKFHDERYIEAAIAWLETVIAYTSPTVFAPFVECNDCFLGPYEDDFRSLLALMQVVYTHLSVNHPELTIVSSIATIGQKLKTPDLQKLAQHVIPFTDVWAISTYRYFDFHRTVQWTDARPNRNELFDWFDSWFALAPKLMPAFAETAWPAEPMKFSGIDMHSSEDYQRAYLDIILEYAESRQVEFLNWLVAVDGDRLQKGPDDATQIWRDCGLYGMAPDGPRPRPALARWERWRGKQLAVPAAEVAS